MNRVYQMVAAVVATGICAAGAVAAEPERAVPGVAAGIEIGHRGCRVTVVQVDKTPWKSNRVQVRFEKTVLHTLGTGLADAGKMNPADIKKTAAQVKRMCELVRTEHGVPEAQVHIATSGSLDGVAGLADLTAAVKDATGRTVTTFTAAREVLYGMKQIMPDDYMRGAWYADVGSGATKFGSYVAEGPTSLPEFRAEQVPGLAEVRERIRKRAEAESLSFADAARKEGDALVAEFRKLANANPALVNRRDVILTGGCVWGLATLIKPEDVNAAYVSVTAEDIARFGQALRSAEGRLPAPDLAAVKWDEVRKAAEREGEQLRDRFTAEQLLAGAELLRAMSEAFRFKGKDVYFPRQGGQAWIAAFAAEQLTGVPVTLK